MAEALGKDSMTSSRERFREEARLVGASVRGPVPEAQIAKAVGESLTARGARRVVVSPRGIPLPEGIEVLEGRAGAFEADAGVTTCDFAIAESATLVCVSSPESPRLPSLLPPLHVAIVRVENLLEFPADLFLFVTPAALSSSVVFITGPSRTGDIEQTMTVGVHGPAALEIVLVESA